MATSAVAREAVCALRREIARIEGTLAERLDGPARESRPALLATGAGRLDVALGGGLPRAALTEIHGRQTRDSGAVAGFTLALAALALKEADQPLPLLWVAAGEAFSEAGSPYAPGILHRFGIAPALLLVAGARRIEDALWIAEEAAALTALSAVILEVRGSSRRLDLTATRRLHHRARDAARPLFLLRQMGEPEPTAAPVRLVVAPAPAGKRRTLFGLMAGSIGPPAFTVTVSRSPAAHAASLVVEWNAHERAFVERHASRQWTQDHGAVAALPFDGAHPADASGSVVALRRRA